MSTKFLKVCIYLVLSALMISSATVNAEYNGWADKYMEFCVSRGIISGDENGNLMPSENLSREQMVKMILNSLSVDIVAYEDMKYTDVESDRWSYSYIAKYQEYDLRKTDIFNPGEAVSREEFMAMTMLVAGYANYKPVDSERFFDTFRDIGKIDDVYLNLLIAGYETKCITGDGGRLRPDDELTRAEACSLLYKIITVLENESDKQHKEDEDNEVINNNTLPENTDEPEEVYDPYADVMDMDICGETTVTLEQAKQWAKNRGAADLFIDAADYYWQYSEITGIRAEVLYAQAAKETAFGKYTGQVKPEQNNFAGIKKYGHNGDAPEDHEDFSTREDGVRGHFNHMCAYVGVDPVGTPHERYKSVKSLAWAGTVKTVKELGGKWCPDKNYGGSIIKDFIEPMKATMVK